MLSVVLIGRNDAHGPNYEKRVALSINGFARLLGSRDEIVFVDWNTPDNQPTLLETLWDVLTPVARERLRVLRVWPRTHERIGIGAPFDILFPIAYNTAIRRTASSTRWVLISTTDMIIVERDPSFRIGEVLATLDDGHYGLPRFELPYALWSALPRADPDLVAAFLRERGLGLGLNEIVTDTGDHLYDAPGDFQLCLRRDLFEIDGLNEGMSRRVLHHDANLARRLALRRGPARALDGILLGYHCEHVLGREPGHAADRVENDRSAYVLSVRSPTLPHQRGNWGLVGEPVEELALTPEVLVRPTVSLTRAVPAPLPRGPYVASRSHAAFGRVDYPLRHVLPFVLGELQFLAPGDIVGYCGINSNLVGALHRALSDCRPCHPILVERSLLRTLVDDDASSFRAPTGRTVDLCEFDRMLQEADALVFDFGIARDDGDDNLVLFRDADITVRETFYRVERMLISAAAEIGEGRRVKVIAVNAVHTPFEPTAQRLLASPLRPFTTRLRVGELPRTSSGSVSRRRVQSRQDRVDADVRDVVSLFARMPDDLPVRGDSVYSGEVLQALSADDAPQRYGLSPAALDALAALVAARRPSALFADSVYRQSGLCDQPRSVGPSQLVAIEDWEAPDWLNSAPYRADTLPVDCNRRHRVDWERIQHLYSLREAGVVSEGCRLALVLPGPDDVVADLARLDRSLDLLRIGSHDTLVPEAWLALNLSFPSECLMRPLGWPVEPGRYDAILLPQNGALIDGARSLAMAVFRAARALKEGGLLAVSLEAILAGPPDWSAFPARVLVDGSIAELVEARTGLVPFGRISPAISAATLDRVADMLPGRDLGPHLVVRHNRRIRTVAVQCWRKLRKIDGPIEFAESAGYLADSLVQCQGIGVSPSTGCS